MNDNNINQPFTEDNGIIPTPEEEIATPATSSDTTAPETIETLDTVEEVEGTIDSETEITDAPCVDSTQSVPTYQPPYQASCQPAFQATPPTPQPPYQPPYQAPYQPPYQAPQGFNAPPYAQTQPYGAPQQNFQPAFQAPQYTPPQPKKKSTGAKVMLICLWVLLGLFTLALIGSASYYMGLNNNRGEIPDRNHPFTDFFNPTEPKDSEDYENEPQATEAVDNSHLFGEGEVVLNKYPNDKNDTGKYNTRTAFEKISPSAVGIMCYKDKAKETPVGQGTGIIINTDGYIATNSHVIGDTKSGYTIEVILTDGNTYDAEVVGFDTRTDLAVIKITAKNLIPAEFADSDLAVIGEDVIAVGNPGGIEFQNTLTRGVISAKDRTLGLSTQVKYIQTDAAINPGNSGGPLCNLYGQVIGINSAKIASEDYEGMGFAIPSRTAKEVIDDLIKQGYVSGRVKIGIMGTAVTASEAYYKNIPQGILVSEVIEGGPCDNGEILSGDIVVALDEYEIKSFNDIYTALMNYKEGDKVTLKVYRPDTEEYLEVNVTLQADAG